MFSMNSLELTSFITLLANTISQNISDDDVLALLGNIFTQLGDTLSTISAKRVLCDKNEKNSGITTTT